MYSRRSTLAGLVGLTSLALAPSAIGQPDVQRTRKNFNNLSTDDPDYRAFAEGIHLMRERSDRLSWEWQRWHHAQYYKQHQSWRFLPWHRIQLAQFERIIARLTGYDAFALPYWDFTTNPFIPINLFRDSDLVDSTRVARPDTNVAKERWAFDQASAFTQQGPFDVFAGDPHTAGAVESLAHNAVHVIVGGHMGSINSAPLDPIFWLHHANVDRVWATRQEDVGYEYPQAFLDEEFEGFVEPSGNFMRPIAAREVLNTRDIGYRFDTPYPNRLFSIPGGAVRKGMVRRQVDAAKATVIGAVTNAYRAEAALPRDMVDAVRNDRDDVLDLYGEVRTELNTAGLANKVVRLKAYAPQGAGGRAPAPVTLAAAPAFFHQVPPGDHSSHSGHNSWAFRIAFDKEIVNLIGASKGPVMIGAETIDLSGSSSPRGPQFVELRLDLELRKHAWLPPA